MRNKKQSRQILDTPARKRLQREIGVKQLTDFEELILKPHDVATVILETQARARLRKELGQAELDRIETAILKGEL